MQRIEDVTPQQHRHVQVPNTTFDHLLEVNALSVTVLGYFLRHSEGYNPTLTKLVDRAGVHREAALSRAYNDLIAQGYLGRVEFTYARPDRSRGQNNPRSTYVYVSSVPLSDERFAAIVHAYTPGRYVFAPVANGHRDEHGNKLYDTRRVKVIAAEVYGHNGAQRIDRDGLLSAHTNARGGKSRTARNQAVRAAAPDPEIPGSGVSSENAASSQVAPEPGSPDSGGPGSIKNTKEEHQENTNGAGASLRSLPPTESSRPSNFRSDDEPVGAPSESVEVKSSRVGESPHARVNAGAQSQAYAQGTVTPNEDDNDAGTSSGEQAGELASPRRSGTGHNGPHSAAADLQGDLGTHGRGHPQIDDQRATQRPDFGVW